MRELVGDGGIHEQTPTPVYAQLHRLAAVVRRFAAGLVILGGPAMHWGLPAEFDARGQEFRTFPHSRGVLAVDAAGHWLGMRREDQVHMRATEDNRRSVFRMLTAAARLLWMGATTAERDGAEEAFLPLS